MPKMICPILTPLEGEKNKRVAPLEGEKNKRVAPRDMVEQG